MPDSSEMELIYDCDEGLDTLRGSEPYLKNRERYFTSRGITESEYHQQLLTLIEGITGPLASWQKFWTIAALSGRGVEWAQTRGRPHYHVVGVPCAVCGRG